MTAERDAGVGGSIVGEAEDADERAAPSDAAAASADARRAVEDPERLAAVRATGLLDSEVEAVFDRLTRLAVRLVGVPAAFLSLVDAERDFYKSACGFGEPLASARELAGPTFCHYAVRSPAPLVIPDTAADPVYRDVPTVRSLGVAAYVGIPLVVRGQAVGSFCAVDTRPRRWTPEDLEVLTELAASAQREVELRATLRAAERDAEELRAQTAELEAANLQLQDQAAELEASNLQLQEQAAELEARTDEAAVAEAGAERARARAARLLARMADANVVLDAEFRIVDVNAAMERGVGLARATLLGRSIWELFPALAGTDAERFYRQVPELGVEAHAIFPYGDGRLDLVAEVDAYPTDDGGLAVFWRDVTARVRAIQALRDSEAKYRALFDAMDQAFAIIEVLVGDADDPNPEAPTAGAPIDYRFLEVNPAFAQQTGLAGATGRTARELVPGLEQHWVDVYGRVALTGEPARFQQGSDVMGRWWDVYAFRVGAPAARRVAILFTDVSEARRADQERERLLTAAEEARREAELAREAAEASARAKAEFLATMSHEIRTPINAIVGYTQLLELGIPDPVTPVQREQLGRVTASARHLLGLVNDVLDVAKLDAGEVAVAREDATTGPAVAAALALVRPQADQRGVRLAYGEPVDAGLELARGSVAPGDVAYVGDEARVRQILVNLLSNAVKFTEAGGTVAVQSGAAPAAPAAAQLTGAGPWAFVAVTDTGVGIAPDRQAAVFDPFVQAAPGQTAYTRTRGGTGLGLTISRRLARLMGGDLTLESAPGVGSTFTLWLPAAGVAVGGAAETAEARGERAGLPGRGWRVHGLAEIGRALREETDAILEAYATTLRADPEAPLARDMPQPQLEDHAITLLADLAQSLVILAGAGDEAAALMGDGTAIQRAVAEAHGARRCAQGWSEAAVRRDHAVLAEVVERGVRARVASRAGDVSEGLRVLAELQARTEAQSLAAFRRACDATAGAAAPGDRTGASSEI